MIYIGNYIIINIDPDAHPLSLPSPEKRRAVIKMIEESNNRLLHPLERIRKDESTTILDEIIGAYSETNKDSLTKEQEEMMKLSEEDVKYGRTISQEDLHSKTSEWLKKRKA